MVARNKGTITRCISPYPSVDSFEMDGILVEVGDLVRAVPPGKRACIARVTQIRLEAEGGPIRELTVALWSKLNGDDHVQKGLTRVLTADAVTPLRRQPVRRSI